MSNKLKGMGDEEQETVLVTESHPMPVGKDKFRDKLFAALGVILSGGGVRKFTVELEKPIKVVRAVPKLIAEQNELPVEDEELDAYEQILEGRMAIASDGDPTKPVGFLELCRIAFDLVTKNGFIPSEILVCQRAQMRECLNSKEEFLSLFGLEVKENKNIPDEVAVLVAVDKDERVAYSVRIEMSAPSVKEQYETHRREDAKQRAD